MAHRQNPKLTQLARDLRQRQTEAESLLWYTLIRFCNEDVLDDVEAVAIAIASHLELEPEFRGKKPS